MSSFWLNIKYQILKKINVFFSWNPPLPKKVTFSLGQKSVTILGNVTIWGATIMSEHSTSNAIYINFEVYSWFKHLYLKKVLTTTVTFSCSSCFPDEKFDILGMRIGTRFLSIWTLNRTVWYPCNQIVQVSL